MLRLCPVLHIDRLKTLTDGQQLDAGSEKNQRLSVIAATKGASSVEKGVLKNLPSVVYLLKELITKEPLPSPPRWLAKPMASADGQI